MFLTDKPVIHEVGYKTYSINCMGMESPMLFVGTKKALLVDTGCGNTDLKALVETLTNLPITVVITHEHADHVGGIVQFDEVYVPAQELNTIASYTTEFMQSFLDFFNGLIEEEPGINGCFRQQKMVLSWDRKPKLLPIHDGARWDLGGQTVTAYHCPVHSKGHMVFVDSYSRILYAGDSIGENTGPANNPINSPIPSRNGRKVPQKKPPPELHKSDPRQSAGMAGILPRRGRMNRSRPSGGGWKC